MLACWDSTAGQWRIDGEAVAVSVRRDAGIILLNGEINLVARHVGYRVTTIRTG